MRLILVAILTSTTLVSGCGISGPISSAKNPSGFEGAVYSGRTDTLNKPTKGVESFRVFNQAATGFSTADAQMGDAYERASRFCSSNGKKMRTLEESRSTGLHVLGNFPRAELVFECVASLENSTQVNSGDNISKLERLKTLLDSGAIKQDEFTYEKKKLFSIP